MMKNRYLGNHWFNSIVFFISILIFNLMLGNHQKINAQSFVNNENNFRHENVYYYYLQNVYNDNIGIRSGWLNQLGVIRPYIDLTWQVPVNNFLQFGIKSLALTEDEYKVIHYKDSDYRSSSLLKLADLEFVSNYLDLSLMSWMKMALTERIDYTLGLVLHNLTDRSSMLIASDHIKGGILNVLGMNLENGKIYFSGLYDFDHNHIFGGIGSVFVTKNLNTQKSQTQNGHFLSNANISLGINPGMIFHVYYDKDIENWRDEYSASLKFFLVLESNFLHISPGITVYYNSQQSFAPDLGFFINLTLLRL